MKSEVIKNIGFNSIKKSSYSEYRTSCDSLVVELSVAIA